MKKRLVLLVMVALAFGACSAKEFNEGVDSVTSDVSKAFDAGKDKSAD